MGRGQAPLWWQEWERGSDQGDTLRGKKGWALCALGWQSMPQPLLDSTQYGDFDLKREQTV